MHKLFNVIGRIRFLKGRVGSCGPLLVFWRYLCSGVKALVAVGSHRLTQQSFAMTLAISMGRIEKVAPGIDGGLQRLERLLIVRIGPAGHPPHPIANFTDFPASTTELSVSHEGMVNGEW